MLAKSELTWDIINIWILHFSAASIIIYIYSTRNTMVNHRILITKYFL